MAFHHPQKLALRKSRSVKGAKFSDLPLIRDRRGRRIYKWDAFYSDCGDPSDRRKRDIWELAEVLDARRLREIRTRNQLAELEERRAARLAAPSG